MKERAAPRIEGLVEAHNAGGRSVYSESAKRALVQACLQPGVSVAASALANGINANLLRKWIRQHQRKLSVSKSGAGKRDEGMLRALLPVELSEPAAASLPAAPTRSKLDIEPRSARASGEIEIEYAGARLIVRAPVGAEQLSVVLTCLRRST
jgi:transposase